MHEKLSKWEAIVHQLQAAVFNLFTNSFVSILEGTAIVLKAPVPFFSPLFSFFFFFFFFSFFFFLFFFFFFFFFLFSFCLEESILILKPLDRENILR